MQRHDHHAAAVAERDAATDPVCGMRVDPATSRHRFEQAGSTFHFCCAGCRQKFIADPAKYLSSPAEPATEIGGAYTCPMHPEIRQAGPGSCPICGMALEPLAISAEPEANPELQDMTRRLWMGAALAVPVVALDMGFRISASTPTGCRWFLRHRWCCGPACRSSNAAGTRSLRRSLNMFTLIAVGTGAA